MRVILAQLILTLCDALETDNTKGTIQEQGAICNELEAEQAIIELHDDLDDDDDGTISTTGKVQRPHRTHYTAKLYLTNLICIIYFR